MEYPSDRPLIQALSTALQAWQDHHVLTVTLGTWSSSFFPGVSFEHGSQLYGDMTNTESISQYDHPPHIEEFTYKFFPQQIRQRYRLGTTQTHRIEPIQSWTWNCTTERRYDLQCDIVSEIPMRSNQISAPREADYTELHTRFSVSQDNGVWQYRFTKLGSGKSTEDGCQNIKVMVQLVFQPNELTWNRTTDSLAVEIIGRARDLLGRFNDRGESVPLPLQLVSTTIPQHQP